MASSSSSLSGGSYGTFSSLTTENSFTTLTPPSTPPPQPSSPSPDQILSSFPLQDNTKTIYVRSLGPDVDPSYIRDLFRPYGFIKGIRVIWERDVDTIAFIEFEDKYSAEKAMSDIDRVTKKNFEDRYGNGNETMTTTKDSGGDAREDIGGEAKKNWDGRFGNANASTTTRTEVKEVKNAKGFSVFVGATGDLTEKDLSEAFKYFGNIKKVLLVRNKETGLSQGFAFVTFADEASARDAIREMNGATVKNTTIGVEWDHGGERKANVKKITAEEEKELERQKEYDKISKEASLDNTTIFVGYRPGILTDQILMKKFYPYGKITGMKCYTDKGYGFIRFKERSSAIQAIHEKNGLKTKSGFVVKVGWGKRLYYGPN